MKKASLPRFFSIIFFFLGFYFAQGQTIGKPEVVQENICAGSDITVLFRVTNGIDWWFGFPQFTVQTKYTLRIINGSGGTIETVFSETFTSDIAPAASTWAQAVIEKRIKIPNDLSIHKDLQIIISSDGPKAESVRSDIFDAISVTTPVAAYQPQTCVGGPIQLTASSISGAGYTWTGPDGFYSTEQNPVITNISEAVAGEYTVTATVNGCTGSPATIFVDPYPSKPGNESLKGQDSWIGHVYDGKNFDRYLGSYAEPEVFDQNFGGNTGCFETSEGVGVFPETFSVKYRMTSSREGIYAVDLGSDDGGRLFIDGKKVYDFWTDQSYREQENVLIYLDGKSELEYHYYENGGDNRVRFGKPTLVMENELTDNLEQYICTGTAAKEISGDAFTDLPIGIEKSGTGYQWYYSTSENGEKRMIKGATSSSYTPNMAQFPFSDPGVYYLFRQVQLLGTNNFLWESHLIHHNSNSAVIEVAEAITSNEITFTGNQMTATVSATAVKGEILTIEAPEGAVFTDISFASYGTPSGSDGDFQQGYCHNPQSEAIVRDYLIGKNSAEIPVTEAVFGDGLWLCEIFTELRLYVTVTYTYDVPSCSGTALGTISGSEPQGGNGSFFYLWESSTTSATEGFSPAPGENNQKEYKPGKLNQTTWFKRTVISGSCETESNVIEIEMLRNEWTGALDTDWHNPVNWSCGTVPNLDTDALIPGGLQNYPVISDGQANGKVHTLTIENNASVEVSNNWLQLGGDLQVDGSLKAVEGSIAFIGDTPQTFPADSFDKNRVANLLVNNTAGVALQGELEVSSTVKIEEGSLHTAGGLVLVSTEEQTALIDGSGKGEVHGGVIVQRYLDPAFGYKYLSSPVKNSEVGDLAAYVDLSSDFPPVYSYNEDREHIDGSDLSGWEAYTDSSSPLRTLQGYAVNFGDEKNTITVSFQGEVNNGPQSITLSNNNGKYTQGFNLVGNPYPSPIDWDSKGWTKHNIDDAIYFFTASEESQYLGTYKSYVSGISSDGSKNSTGSIIPSMQGFFVHVSDSEDYPVEGRLGLTNEVRVTDFQQEFYKSARTGTGNAALIRLNAQYENGGVPDPAVVYFNPSGTASFEKGLDALKMMNTDVDVPNFYSLTSSEKELSINAINFAGTGDTRISLGIKAEKAGSMKIGLQDLENFPAGLNIYLIDLEQRISKDLTREGAYSFRLEKGTHNSRFELLISEEQLKDIAVAFNEPFSVLASEGSVLVRLNLDESQTGTLRLVSLNGQILSVREAGGKEQVEIAVKSSGIYIVSLTVGEDLYTKKVLIR